jgi:hypothetical protein
MLSNKDFIIHVAKSQLKPYPLNMIPFGDCFFIYVSKTTTIILLYCKIYNHVHNVIVTRFWNYYTNWFEILLTSLEIVWLGSVGHISIYLLIKLTFELKLLLNILAFM